MKKGQAVFSVNTRNSQRGHAFLELAFFIPVFFFLFVGAFDLGFYSYALICTQSAARVAVEATSASSSLAGSSSTACTAAIGVMSTVPNGGSLPSTCNALPLTVSATSVTASDGSTASQVAVKYRTNLLIPIPGLLEGQLVVQRVAKMRVRS